MNRSYTAEDQFNQKSLATAGEDQFHQKSLEKSLSWQQIRHILQFFPYKNMLPKYSLHLWQLFMIWAKI